MTKNNKPTILDCVDDVFKSFVNNRGEIELSENINPAFVMFMTIFMEGLRQRLLGLRPQR